MSILVTTVVCLLLVSSTGLTVGSQAAPQRGPESVDPQRGPGDVKIVTVHPDSRDRLWPFTSRERRFETLTLPMNAVVRGNDTRVRWFLRTGRHVNWNESEEEWQGVGGEELGGTTGDLAWYEAHGATRYTYIESTRDPHGGWVDESYQLHDGDYFGTRYHLRAYTGGRGNASWTAVQAHREHWDWFRLRHTVGSTADAQRYVEQSFYGSPAVARIGRQRFANGGNADSDGWATVAVMQEPEPPEPGETATGMGTEPGTETEGSVRRASGFPPSATVWGLAAVLIAGAGLSVGVGDVRRRLHELEVEVPERLAALFVVSLLTMPTLRWASITAERTVPSLPPKLIAGLGYLVLAVWLPVVVLLLARGTRADRAAPLVAVGFGAGILFDYALVGITLVPVSVMLHRLAVVLAVGLFAAAGTRLWTDRPGHVAVPVAAAFAWAGVLVRPLVDLL